MTPKSKKKLLQGLKDLQQHDSNIARAVDYVYKHPLESKSKIAHNMGVSYATLRRQLNGHCESRAKARIAQQLLSTAEESAIVDWCLKMADKGFPVSVLMLRSMAIIVLQARLGSGTSTQIIEPPGANWHNRFLARHSEVKLRYA